MTKAANIAAAGASLSADANGNVTIAGATTASFSSINSGPLAGNRNRIINGAFDIWQYGTSFSAVTPVFTADRWFVTHAGSSLTATYSQQASGGTWNGAKFYIRLARTSGSSMTTHSFTQRIEGVENLSDGKATFSLDCRDLTGARTASVRLVQNFGSGGSADVTIASQSISIPTGSTPQRRSVTFDVPSIAGKTVGANNYLALIIDLPLGENFQIDISNVQLEPGIVATPFERRLHPYELALCQRYCEAVFASGVGADKDIGFGAGNGNTNFQASVFWKVQKRAAPTLTLAAANNFYCHVPGVFRVTCNTISAADATEWGTHINGSTASNTLSAGQGCFLAAVPNTTLIIASAEL